jgi:hypothetical protein
MFSKILKYSVLIFASYLWLQAYSPLIYKTSPLFPDDYRNGDLYHLSYLPQFKEKLPICQSQKRSQNVQNVNLYVIGDSFTEEQRVNKNDINAINYLNVHWNKCLEIQLDTTKKNVLILETVERTFKNHFSGEVNNINLDRKIEKIDSNKSWKRTLIEKINQIVLFIFPEKDGIEQRFEASLFSYDFFLKFRELKAMINQSIFDRIEKKVVLSEDKNNIFFSEEALHTDSHSAFYPLTEVEKDSLILTINKSGEKYLKAGFDEVYLSIIPNKVSILSPNLGAYNHLIERIQNDSKLTIPLIDTYTEFKKNPSIYYLKSDSHWTCEGRDVWLNKVNKILSKP